MMIVRWGAVALVTLALLLYVLASALAEAAASVWEAMFGE